MFAIFASVMVFNLSAAELIPTSGVSILYVNGQEAESKISINEIDVGFNQLVVRMDKEVGRGSGNGVFTSKPYVIDVNVSGDQVRINHPRARSVKEAELAFEKAKPEWVITQDGSSLEYKQELLQGKQGIFPYLGMASLIEKHNAQRGIYFNDGQLIDKPVEAKMLPVAAATDVAVKANPKAKERTVSGNVDQLKAWYLKSSTEERKAFRRWMIDQE